MRRHLVALLLSYVLFGALLVLPGAAGSIGRDQGLKAIKEKLNILVIASPELGHFIPTGVLGGALSQRGHNVSLMSTEREGFDREEFAENAGMHFISAGKDPFYTKEEYLRAHAEVEGQDSQTAHGMISTIQLTIHLFTSAAEQYQEHLHKLGNQWDVIIVGFQYYPTVVCQVQRNRWDVAVIATSPSGGADMTFPGWLVPLGLIPYSDNLSFFQRLHMTVVHSSTPLIWRTLVNLQCTEPNSSHVYYAGTMDPLILFTAIGFEYPRTVLPMVHYVGPIFSSSSDEGLPTYLEDWLTGKEDRSVIYISMGSTVHLSEDIGSAIIDGVRSTNFSVLWSLRESNREFLEGRQLESSRFLIWNWLPQRALLKSIAIAMTITHGGMGGVSESLFHEVPLIVMPFGKDQPGNAARVQSSGAGISLDKDTLTAEDIRKAVETVAFPEYRKAAARLRRIFLHAGGVERAADLVEFYSEVGYEHLIPAYAKYQWSWVQYYNVDVYVFITVCFTLIAYVVFKVCAFTGRVICRRKSKTD